MRACGLLGNEGPEGPVAPSLQTNEDKTAALESEQSLPSVSQAAKKKRPAPNGLWHELFPVDATPLEKDKGFKATLTPVVMPFVLAQQKGRARRARRSVGRTGIKSVRSA